MSEAPYDPYVPKGGADPQAGGQSRTQALQGVSWLQIARDQSFGSRQNLLFGYEARFASKLSAGGQAVRSLMGFVAEHQTLSELRP